MELHGWKQCQHKVEQHQEHWQEHQHQQVDQSLLLQQSVVLKSKSDKVRQTDCRAEI